MKCLRIVCAVTALALATSLPADAGAGALGRAVTRGAAKSLARAGGRGAAKSSARALARRDMVRDLRTAPKPLARPRTVYRYVPGPRAKREVRRGISPGRHFASRPAIGRPLSGSRAKQVYGLPQKPGAVETVRIPAKQPVRLNKVLGGARGRGEITSPKPLPSSTVRAVHPVR